MAEFINKGISLRGRLKMDGVTFYTKNGKTIMRSSMSEQPHRRTRGQFVSRQRVAHNMALWKRLRETGRPAFAGGNNIYGRFCTLMRKLPVAYLTKDEHKCDCALLMPGMPVSDGMLPDIEYHLGEVAGLPALVTTLKVRASGSNLQNRLFGNGGGMEGCDTLRLYRLTQSKTKFGPRLDVKVEEWHHDDEKVSQPFDGIELRTVDGCLALTGEVLGDPMRGWALVRMADDRSSSQTVATRCTLYEKYTTDEALARSAESYGGLTE